MADCPCLVFVTRNGTPLGARNVQRDFRKVIDAAGLPGREWTPRELRQSFVSLLSDAKVPMEVIARLVGHRSTTVTETVYRKQLRPVIEGGASVMYRIFPPRGRTGSLVTQLVTQRGPPETPAGRFWLVGATGIEPVTPRL
jgi:Phage integrase family